MSTEPTNPLASEADRLYDAERRAMRRVLTAITEGQPSSSIFQMIAEDLHGILRAHSVAIGLAPPEGASMEFVAASGGNPSEILGLRVAIADTLADPALRGGQPMLLDAHLTPGARTGAVAPIMAHDEVIGAIFAADESDAVPLTESGLGALTVFAGIAALAVATGRKAHLLREQGRELAILYRASQTITGTVSLQAVAESALDAIAQHVPMQTAVLYLLNDDRTHLFIAADRGLDDDEREVQLSADSGLAGEIVSGGEARRLADGLDGPDVSTVSPAAHSRSAMIAPLRSAGETLGLFVVTSTQSDAYTDDDLRLLNAVSSHAGIAIHNATLFEDATQRAEAANALFTFSQRVGATLEVPEILACASETATALLAVDAVLCMLMDHRDGRLRPAYLRGFDEGGLGRYRPRPGEGIAGWVYAWSCPTAVADVAADARDRSAPIHPEGVASCLCVPLSVGETVHGVVLAMSSRRRLFTVAEMELLYTIANQAGLAIVNAHAYARAQERSLAMRRYFRRFAAAIGSVTDVAQMLQLICDVTLALMKADRCSVYAVANEELRLVADSRLPGRHAPDAAVPLGAGLTGNVASSGRVLSVPLVGEDLRSAVHGWFGREQHTAYLGVPLKNGRRITGVIELTMSEPHSLSPDDIRLITQFILKARLGERLIGE